MDLSAQDKLLGIIILCRPTGRNKCYVLLNSVRCLLLVPAPEGRGRGVAKRAVVMLLYVQA